MIECLEQNNNSVINWKAVFCRRVNISKHKKFPNKNLHLFYLVHFLCMGSIISLLSPDFP